VTVVLVEGEQFTAPSGRSVNPSGGERSGRRWPWFLAGLVFGLAAMFGGLKTWERTHPAPPPPPPPQVLTVGPGQPFGHIAEALTQARPGDTVEVLAGEYREQVKLKSGVVLRSRVPREAVIMSLPMSDGPVVSAENVTDARLAGFLIRVDQQTPVSAAIVLTDSEVEVSNVEVTGARVGIEVRGGGSPRLIGNSIHDCAAGGILISGTATPWILHNAVRNNKGVGLEAREAARPAVLGNVFDRNPVRLPVSIPAATVRAQNVFLEARRALP
jgi:parallel beta-helix repeat protein